MSFEVGLLVVLGSVGEFGVTETGAVVVPEIGLDVGESSRVEDGERRGQFRYRHLL